MSTKDEWAAFDRLVEERTSELREIGLPYHVASDLAYWETRQESIEAAKKDERTRELSAERKRSMNVTMHWTGKDRPSDPAIRVEHFEHNKDTPKRITFYLGGEMVEIWTNGVGLKMIADAIADHPKELEREAKAALEEAEKRYRQFGGVTVEAQS